MHCMTKQRNSTMTQSCQWHCPAGASLRVGAFQPKKAGAVKFKREKNWGFVEEEGALMIYYALLPCTVVMEFDTQQPDGVLMRSRACYDDQAAAIEQQTGVQQASCGRHCHTVHPQCCLSTWLTMLRSHPLYCDARCRASMTACTYQLAPAHLRTMSISITCRAGYPKDGRA